MRDAVLREGLEFKKPLTQRVLKAVLTEVTQ